jgi:hypothetical protein
VAAADEEEDVGGGGSYADQGGGAGLIAGREMAAPRKEGGEGVPVAAPAAARGGFLYHKLLQQRVPSMNPTHYVRVLGSKLWGTQGPSQ